MWQVRSHIVDDEVIGLVVPVALGVHLQDLVWLVQVLQFVQQVSFLLVELLKGIVLLLLSSLLGFLLLSCLCFSEDVAKLGIALTGSLELGESQLQFLGDAFHVVVSMPEEVRLSL